MPVTLQPCARVALEVKVPKLSHTRLEKGNRAGEVLNVVFVEAERTQGRKVSGSKELAAGIVEVVARQKESLEASALLQGNQRARLLGMYAARAVCGV